MRSVPEGAGFGVAVVAPFGCIGAAARRRIREGELRLPLDGEPGGRVASAADDAGFVRRNCHPSPTGDSAIVSGLVPFPCRIAKTSGHRAAKSSLRNGPVLTSATLHLAQLLAVDPHRAVSHIAVRLIPEARH